jgi:hypothetical protein
VRPGDALLASGRTRTPGSGGCGCCPAGRGGAIIGHRRPRTARYNYALPVYQAGAQPSQDTLALAPYLAPGASHPTAHAHAPRPRYVSQITS